MTNLTKVFQAIGYFLIFYFVIIVINYIMGPLIDSLVEATGLTDFESIIWFSIAILWLIMALVLPSAKLYEGLTEEPKTQPNKIGQITIAGIIIVFGLLLTIKIWQLDVPGTLDGLANGETFIRILFWLGCIITWLEIIVATPIYMIIDANKN